MVPQFDRYYDEAVKKAENEGTKHSIFASLVWTFGPTFIVGSAQKLCYDVLAMVSPQLMNLMIDFVESYALGEDDQQWKGYFYASVLLVVLCLMSVVLSQYFERMFLVAMNVRTALVSVVYRKALRMSNAARKESTVGEIVNLMSVDVQRFMDLLPYVNLLWCVDLLL